MGWNDVNQNDSAGQSGGKKEFLRIDTEKRIRILTAPEIFYKHWAFTANGKQTTIKCPGSSQCLVCQRNPEPEGRPRKRGIMVVLDRSDEQLKFYDVPNTVLGQLKTYHEDAAWGPLHGYDIVIKKAGIGRRTDYQVIPSPHQALPAEVMTKVQAELGTFDLVAFARPHTPEEILAIVNNQPKPQVQASAGNPATPQFNVNTGGAAPPAQIPIAPPVAPVDVAPVDVAPAVAQAPAPGAISPTSIPPVVPAPSAPPAPAPAPPAVPGTVPPQGADTQFFKNFL